MNEARNAGSGNDGFRPRNTTRGIGVAGFHVLKSMAAFGKWLRDWGNADCHLEGKCGWRRWFLGCGDRLSPPRWEVAPRLPVAAPFRCVIPPSPDPNPRRQTLTGIFIKLHQTKSNHRNCEGSSQSQNRTPVRLKRGRWEGYALGVRGHDLPRTLIFKL